MAPSARFRGLALHPASFCALFSVFPAQAQTTLITQSPSGEPADGGAIYAEISRDGRYISFQSGSTNLVAGDTNGHPDAFRYDRETNTMLLVSSSTQGVPSNGDNLDPVISLDGQHVTWFSYATNLVAGDTNNYSDIFVHDVAAGTTKRVPESFQLNGGSRYPVISGDGLRVAFETFANNAVPGDTNGARDVFVYDFSDGTLVRASTAADGSQASGESYDAWISESGRYVSFESNAPDLVPGDTNDASDVFVKDLLTGAITRVSVNSAGEEGNAGSFDPSLSADGRRVAFSSEATNLTATVDSNGYVDIFLHDLDTGLTQRVNEPWNGATPHVGAYEPAISPDGGFVSFFSQASNLVPDDRNSTLDIFVRDVECGTTQRISAGPLGEANDSCFYPALSEGGRFVVFDSTADNLVPGDTNGGRDIFLHDRRETYLEFCVVDGLNALVCPCGNLGGPGQGCANSSGQGGWFEASGSTSVSSDDLRFTAHELLPGNPALLFFGDGLAQSGAGLTFGDGRRCVGGSIVRVGISVPSSGGLAYWGSGLGSQGFWQPGDVRRFQVWYRDPAGPCSNGFNLTQAIELCFAP